ncbi:hypothetical protein A8709_13450 [Paenibacillus pectinilyticus]|uniref:ABC transporter substrate-binding protein n=1 Tax=Paenibacillus pectinilyticus TaxID=512399 RepID=A0A1C1A3Q4_9BACL|nr:extracellular solute-binding protein [Paenibacillus pectinilyticus]OCT15110.1 hypothetical protein A8709_13450 [Paenibacillus pectinilyticus]
MKKTTVSMLAVTMMLSIVLSACSKSSTTDGTANPTSPAASTGTSTTAPVDTNKFAKKMTITAYNAGGFTPTFQPPTNRDEDYIRVMLEKAVNIDLQMTVPTPDQIKPKLNTMIAGGDVPDMIFMTDYATAVQYYDQGITADLDTALKDFPNYVKAFSQDNWDAKKYKGKTIGVPGYELVNGINGWWIRNDWLTKLNLKAPTTPDELLEVMKAFTFNDPDGNGKQDTYGFTTGILKDGNFNYPGNSGFGWDAIMMMFGVVPNMVDSIDGKITFDNTDPRMKEALTFMNKMIEAKVVDPDWVSQNDATALQNKMYSGKVGIVFQDWRQMELNIQKKMQDAGGSVPDWNVIPAMKGPHGDQLIGFAQFQGNAWAISKNAAKDPEKVKRILSLLQYWYTDPEAYNVSTLKGPKGITWDLVDGKVVINKENLAKDDIVNKYNWSKNYALPRKGNDANYFNYTFPKTADFLAVNAAHVKSNKVNPFVVPDPNDTLYNDRIKFVNESFLKFILGKDPISNWDNFVKTMDTKFDYANYKKNVISKLKEAGIE